MTKISGCKWLQVDEFATISTHLFMSSLISCVWLQILKPNVTKCSQLVSKIKFKLLKLAVCQNFAAKCSHGCIWLLYFHLLQPNGATSLWLQVARSSCIRLHIFSAFQKWLHPTNGKLVKVSDRVTPKLVCIVFSFFGLKIFRMVTNGQNHQNGQKWLILVHEC